MGVEWTSKAFEVSKETKERIESGEHYYVDMEQGGILFDDQIPSFIQQVREDYKDYYGDLSDEEILNECNVVDYDNSDDWGYWLGGSYFYITQSGDIVYIINYAY